MADDTDAQGLKPLERIAMRIAISGVAEPARREALVQQMEALHVREREYTGVGFYTYFTVSRELHSAALCGIDHGPAAAFGMDHPSRSQALWFLLYATNGYIDFLEGVCSHSWYEEFASAGRWQGGEEPILFEPSLITLG